MITHAHAGRIGGINTLRDYKIETISTGHTAKEAEKNGFKKPDSKIPENGTNLTAGGLNMEVFYPGAGHSPDNVTVWFKDYKVLVGGCLVKSMEAHIGNT